MIISHVLQIKKIFILSLLPIIINFQENFSGKDVKKLDVKKEKR